MEGGRLRVFRPYWVKNLPRQNKVLQRVTLLAFIPPPVNLHSVSQKETLNTLLKGSNIYSTGRNANNEGNVSELRLTFLLLLNRGGGNSPVINHWFFEHTIRNRLPLNLQANCEKKL